MDLKLKINEAKANITKAVLLEQKKDTGNYAKQQKRKWWQAKKNDAEK